MNRKTLQQLAVLVCLVLLNTGCVKKKEKPVTFTTFLEDLKFVEKFTKPILLKSGESSILVTPDYEAIILTSTTSGNNGFSNGYLNQTQISENIIHAGGNQYGGEDRLWLAPLGSRFTLFYKQNPIEDENWFIPKAFDATPFSLNSETSTSLSFQKEVLITNNIGTSFNIRINRDINIFSKTEIEKELNIKIGSALKHVGFQSKNTITNIGLDWSEEKGLITPWVLGMYKGNNKSTAIFPYTESDSVTTKISTYLNDIKTDRLIRKNGNVLFKTDGAYRSKIGLKPKNVLPIFGNYDGINEVLTVITFSFRKEERFLSSDDRDLESGLWNGDVINSYNNGENKDGMATFFELESAAHGKTLKSNENITHTHKTFHFTGDKKELSKLCSKLFNIELKDLYFD